MLQYNQSLHSLLNALSSRLSLPLAVTHHLLTVTGQKSLKSVDGAVEIVKSYYRCNLPGCPMRKQVERFAANDQVRVVHFIGNYHNHPPSWENQLRTTRWAEDNTSSGVASGPGDAASLVKGESVNNEDSKKTNGNGGHPLLTKAD